ncbi:MAG: hypothetical protein PHV74_06780 [Dehalococcoidia bacterium]|nr:hypothetical protein [Dehalococcoidia bacterium]
MKALTCLKKMGTFILKALGVAWLFMLMFFGIVLLNPLMDFCVNEIEEGIDAGIFSSDACRVLSLIPIWFLLSWIGLCIWLTHEYFNRVGPAPFLAVYPVLFLIYAIEGVI